MARIRTIKPEFPQSESMGRVSRDARLTFVLLWTLADDAGRLRGSSRMLASLLYPYDDDAKGLIEAWLGELEREGCVIRYRIGADSYLQICNWLNHQKIDKPSKSKIPAPEEGSRILANPLESSRTLVGGSKDLRIKDQGSKDQGRDLPSASATPARMVPRGTIRHVVTDSDPNWMLDFKLAYPNRAGDQGWGKAARAANARIAEGHSTDEFIAGAKRYAEFCEASGKTGTEYVKQACTFLGPDKPFLQPWDPPLTKAGARLAGNLSAAEEFMRRTEPAQ